MANRYHQRMPASADELRLPGTEDEARFWALLETAWARCTPEADRARQALAKPGSSPAAGLAAIEPAVAVFLDHLAGLSRRLPADEVASLDRVLERKLYDIDRVDIQRVTDGSDDGCLYARGFIVAMGRRFYNAVASNPDLAVPDAECEEMCYFFAHLYRERFGEFPAQAPGSPVKRVQTRPDGPADPSPEVQNQNHVAQTAAHPDLIAAGRSHSSARAGAEWAGRFTVLWKARCRRSSPPR